MGVRPENSLAGIAAAIEAGADGVEIDVRATRDGVPVLMHDASLARTTGDARAVAEVTREQLRTLRVADPFGDAGPQPVPTLAEALEAASAILLVIEVKQPGIEDAVARAVRDAHAFERCRVWSFDPEVCAAYARALPGVPVSLLAGSDADAPTALARALELHLAGVSLEHTLVDERIVRNAHAAGLEVACWTVNDPAEARRLRAAGVDAICTDHPARLASAVRG
jgi:glycerophosphoryl diester phosphodiesterase